MRLAVVILNFRTPDLIRDCLEALRGEIDSERDAIVVVDNGSGDGSADRIGEALRQQGWGAGARLVELPANTGFAGGTNAALRAVDAESYLLLNSDATVRPGAVERLRKAADERPDAGIIGPRIESSDGTPQVACFRHPTPLGELVWAAGTGPVTRLLGAYLVPCPIVDHPSEPAWVSFACALIRRQVIEQVGFLDDGYFMYFEDADYCRRARAAGWRVLHWPAARVVHHRAATRKGRDEDVTRAHLPFHYWVSRARYFAKHHGRGRLWTANLLWMLGRAVSLSRETLGRKARHTAPGEGRLIWTNWREPLQPRGEESDSGLACEGCRQ